MDSPVSASKWSILVISLAALLGSACEPFGDSGDPMVMNQRVCDGSCETRSLTSDQISTVLQQAIDEMQAQGVAGTVAVVDRVGNALAVLEVRTAVESVAIGSNPNALAFPGNGLEDVPSGGQALGFSAAAAALSKAGTAAYLSTQGGAFSTRTFGQLIQESFNPGEPMQASGPLFGAQLSQLRCGDFVRRSSVIRPLEGRAGPKALPLGMSGDPGGAPLYIAGDPVGGVGVEIDGLYTVDRQVSDDDRSIEEIVAFAAQRSFQPNPDREAPRISVRGKLLRYRDAGEILSPRQPALLSGTPVGGALVDVPGFFLAADGIRPGVRLLAGGSGYALLPDYLALGSEALSTGPVRIPVTNQGLPYLGISKIDRLIDRFPLEPNFPRLNPRDSFFPRPFDGGLTSAQAGAIAASAIQVARRARAQLRTGIDGSGRPFLETSVAVVDLDGNVVALVESPDAPIFATDVAIQKARTAVFLSAPQAEAGLLNDVELRDPIGFGLVFQSQPLGTYVQDVRMAIGDPTVLSRGLALTTRTLGALARPFFPDGVNGNLPGPLSKAIETFSPFNTGLAVDLVIDRLLIDLVRARGIKTCTGQTLLPIRSGIQIYAGGVPIFKSGVLVGAIGAAGDAPEQDNLVAFEGLRQAGITLGGDGVGRIARIGNAPPELRFDTVPVPVPGAGSVRLPYVACPISPFLDGDTENACID